jgi:uncharacterized protein VirK/YbjX
MKHSILTSMFALLTGKATLAGSSGLRRGLTWAAKSSWLLANPRIAAELTQVLGSRETRSVLRADPRVLFKFLYGYLSTDLSREERAAMLIHHYTFLRQRTRGDFFQDVVEQPLLLWEHAVGERVYRMSLSVPIFADGEGDLAIYFSADGVDIYFLSFTIGPGSICGLDGAAMYIARMQGKGKGLDQIRLATRDCGDISPARLLLAAAEGIAQALDLSHMVGIGAMHQVSTAQGSDPSDLVKAYDEFWQAAGGTKIARDMYHLALPVLGKPIREVKRDHRSRTLRKRRFKTAIRDAVGEAFRTRALV